MRVATLRAAAVLLLALVVLAATAAAGSGAALFGTYTPQVKKGIFTNLNYWLMQANTGQGPSQAVRVVECGWAPPAADGHIAAIDDIRNAWGWSGAVPIITWMPYGYNTWTSPTPNQDIVDGVYDDYIDAFLTQLSDRFIYEPNAVVKRAYLRFAPQPNGNWFPWSPFCPQCGNTGQRINQTAESYIDMWKYVIAKVRDPKYKLTEDTVQVVFDAATYSASGAISTFYPPDDLVQWFAVTGLNWGNTLPGNSWLSPSQLFSATLGELRALNSSKPTGIMSGGTTSHPNGLEAKGQWITELCQLVTQQGLKMLSYHNADSSTDIAVFGGEAGLANFSSPTDSSSFYMYPQFRDCVAGPGFYGRNLSDTRYISDEQFAGL